MKLIRSGFRNYVDHTSDRATALRGPAMLQDLKLLDRLVREVLQQTSHDVVFVVSAIDVYVYLSAISAIEGYVSHSGLGGIEITRGPRLRHNHRKRGEG